MSDTENAGPPLSDADLESILKRRRLSDPRRERVLERVFESLGEAPPPPRRQARRWPAVIGLAGATAAVVVALGLRERPSHDRWQPRGEASRGEAASLSFDLGCSGGTPDHCPAGSVLIVRVQGTTTDRYLSAYADPVAPGGQRIWYFTGVPLPSSVANMQPTTLKQGVHVGPEHSALAYDVHLIATRKPFSQAALATLDRTEIVAEQVRRLGVVP